MIRKNSSMPIIRKTQRINRELRTLEKMFIIYCTKHHKRDPKDKLCLNCQELLQYAKGRVNNCPYLEKKPTCKKCPIHCYRKTERESIRNIMRYAGPRMAYLHPWLAIMHFYDEFRSKKSK
jgi:hypothetical protein